MFDCLRWLYCVNESERQKDRCPFGNGVSAGGSTQWFIIWGVQRTVDLRKMIFPMLGTNRSTFLKIDILVS